MNVLTDLKSLGYEVTLRGDNVKLSWKGQGDPDPILIKPYLDELKAHKAEVIEVLKASNRNGEPGFDYKALTLMTLSEFEKAGMVLKINSRVLGEIVFFVSDDKAVPGDLPEGATYYTAGELQALINQKVQSDSLRIIHQAKKVFDNATITSGPKPKQKQP